MSPRPRTKSDEEIFAALHRAIAARGPDKLSLADVAEEAGLAPATLIQRFGSKRGLLLAFAKHFYGRLNTDFESARESYSSPLAALVGFLAEMASTVKTPEEMANQVAFLHIDLTDPEFYRLFLDWSNEMLLKLQSLVASAVYEGELVRCDTERCARAVWVTYNGSLVTWAIHRRGSIDDWVRNNLEAVLGPLRR